MHVRGSAALAASQMPPRHHLPRGVRVLSNAEGDLPAVYTHCHAMNCRTVGNFVVFVIFVVKENPRRVHTIVVPIIEA